MTPAIVVIVRRMPLGRPAGSIYRRKKREGAMKRLIYFVIVSAIYATASPLTNAQEIRIRKHVEDMTPQEWTTLEKAISALHKLDKFDASGKSVFPQGRRFL